MGIFSVIVVSNVSSVLIFSFFSFWHSHYAYVTPVVVELQFLGSIFFPYLFALVSIFKSQFDNSNILPPESGLMLSLSLWTVFLPFSMSSKFLLKPRHDVPVAFPGDFCLWVSALLSCHSLPPPVCLSNCGGGSLPRDLNSLRDLRRVVGFQFVQLFTYCWDGMTTSKLLIYRTENQKSLRAA